MLDTSQRREGHVTLGQTQVRYAVAGARNDRAPLVMVHGTAGSTESHFGYLFPMMAFRQRVIAIDLAEPLDERLELADLVAQVRAVIETECPDGVVTLMGYSLGAVVAAATAADLPAKVANLILVAGWMKTDTHQRLRNRVWRQLQAEGSAALTEYMTFCAFSPAFDNLRSLDDMVAAAGMLKITPFVERQMDLNSRIDITEAVERITACTLVIGCRDDMMVPRHHSKALFGAIENARYAEIPSGHGVVFERPAELFHLIDSFSRAPQAHPAGSILPAQKP